MEKSKLLFFQKLINLQNVKNVTHIDYLDTHLCSFLSLELQRTLSLKMQKADVSTEKICEVLSVSPQFVSKWKKKYDSEGLDCLPIQYEGRSSYLSAEQREEFKKNWIRNVKR